VSAPIAREILEQGLALEHGFDPGLVAVSSAVGSFAQITSVDYKNPPRAMPAAMSAARGPNQPVVARAIPVNTPSPPELPVARAIPVGSPSEDPDDPETIDASEAVEPVVRRAIYVGPPRVHPPEIRPAADVIVEVRPPSS
jgi:hypothetical protein